MENGSHLGPGDGSGGNAIIAVTVGMLSHTEGDLGVILHQHALGNGMFIVNENSVQDLQEIMILSVERGMVPAVEYSIYHCLVGPTVRNKWPHNPSIHKPLFRPRSVQQK